MIKITKKAKLHFMKLLSDKKKNTQIRVFVLNPGTLNAECGVSYCFIDDIESTDVKISFTDFCVYIDEISFPYLEDAVIDFVTNEFDSQLTIKAPKIRESRTKDVVLFERINNYIQGNINPQLNLHNGYITLIEITDDGYVVLKFHGGCNGCSMANRTLKEAIEKQLLKMFPSELKGVRDLTNHKHGIHSFY